MEHGWSGDILALQIRSGLHQRHGQAVTNFRKTLPPPHSDLAQALTKGPYLFDFLTLTETANERAAFCRQSSPGVFDQDATHRLGRRADEMRAVLKRRPFAAAQPQPGLVDKGGRLESVASGLVGHLPRRQTAQFLVDDREKFARGFGIAVLQPFQQVREFA